MSSEGPQRILVLGCGRMGRIHAANVSENSRTKLAGLFSRSKTNAETAIRELSLNCPAYGESDLSSLAVDPEIDAVIIATSTDSHSSLIELFISEGKPVLCEKPVSNDKEVIQKLFGLAEKKNVVLAVGYQKRYDESFKQATRAVRNGDIGDPALIRLISRDHPAPDLSALDGAGSFIQDFSTHDADMAYQIMGAEPVSVHAWATANLPAFKDAGLDDTALIALKYANGAICLIDNSRRTTYGYDQRLEILGTEGMIQVENPRPHQMFVSSAKGTALSTSAEHSFPQRYDSAYRNELYNFVDKITGKTPYSVQDEARFSVAASDLVFQAQAAATEARAQASGGDQPPAPAVHYPEPMTGTLGIAVLGLGRMGEIRLKAAMTNPHCKVIAVFDVNTERANQVGKEYGVQVAATPDEAIQHPDVNAVFVCTTSAAHATIIHQAAGARKPIFCEKPISTSAKETQDCVNACQKAETFLYCGFQRRLDPHFQEAASRVRDSGGRVESLRITSRDAASHNSLAYLAASGNYFFDSLIHDFDVVQWIAQEQPVRVHAYGASFIPELRDIGQLDSVAVVCEFKSGLVATIDNNRRATFGYDQRLEAFVGGDLVKVDNVPATTCVRSTSEGDSRSTTTPGMERYAQAYAREVHHFIDVCRGNAKTNVTMADVTGAHLMAAAAQESAKLGRPVALAGVGI